jgi:ribosomal protein L30E
MKFKYVRVLIFIAVAGSCNAEANKEEAVKYFKERKFELGGNGIVISNVVINNTNVTKVDLEHICDLSTVKVLFFRSTHLEKGAIRGLERCDKLESVFYEKGSDVLMEDLVLYDAIPNLDSLLFRGNQYGDELMPYLGRLKNLKSIYIQPGGRPEDQKNGGSLTDEGIRLFAEARKSETPIWLVIQNQPKVTDKAFQYFLQIKGLVGIDFGTNQYVTEDGMHKFAKEYHEKYSVWVEMANR